MTPSQAPNHVAMLASPGMGNLIPVIELAKRLVLHQGVTATLITFSNFASPTQDSFLADLPPGLSLVALPHISLNDLPTTARITTLISVLAARSVPYVSTALRTLKATTHLAAYIVDIFGGDTFSAAVELGIPRFLFSTSNFMFLSLMLHLPTLDAVTSCEYRDLPEPVSLPGCLPVSGKDLLDTIQDRKDDAYRWFVHHAEHFRNNCGILVNSSEDLEPEAVKVFSQTETGRPPTYAVGPLTRTTWTRETSECLEWLDRQPAGSVLFVSFGSGGTLSTVQTGELAAGLQMSGQRFLWVVRRPSNGGESCGAYLDDKGVANLVNFLPHGFPESSSSNKEVGLVVPNWAPQIQVLAHVATGGFLSHCGWNSAQESILNGVPMIAWPLHAEQRMNALILTEGVGVALRPAVTGENGVVGRDEVARVVSELMEGIGGGKAARERVRELKAKALSKEGSSSYKGLTELASTWKDSISV